MLESTVRSQAKQLASFKRQMSNEQQEKKYQEVTMAASYSEEESEEKDERFDRILQMTELLVQEAQKALIYQAQETGGRVISGYYHEWHKQE
jgi:VIT1/CCC1 family predicted Fe2+/Mn2+ transporter